MQMVDQSFFLTGYLAGEFRHPFSGVLYHAQVPQSDN
jgi:hypothetical protein